MTTLLRVLLDQQGWKDYSTFVHQFRLAARSLAQETGEASLATLTLSESTFERWYFGKVTPQNDARRVLTHLFKRPINQLLANVAQPVESPPPDYGAVSPSAPHTELRADHDADPYWMERHAAMAARRAIRFAMGAERSEVGQETLSHLKDEAHRIAEIYVRVPLGTVLDDLIHNQSQTFRLLESGNAKPSQVRDLYLLGSLQSGMLAKASHDLGDPQSAMMQARTAAVCADQAEHRGMSAWVRGLQSLISYWADRPEDALHYARQGTSTGTGLRGSITIWLAGLEARAAALVGDAETVHAANRRAEELRDRTVPDDLDAFGGDFYFPQAKQAYYDVEACVLLGDGSSNLVRRAEEAVRSYSDSGAPHWAFGDQAGTHADLALARLCTGDLDGAVEAVQPVLDLPPSQRNAGIIGSVQRVRTSLMRGMVRDARAAKELREEIAAFSSRPTLSLPS
ncbi:hypothetical protein CFP59_04635 [Streptomyces malaysiensis subsp. malaysiensis]|uniref:hypothetical protein n=1 Tax=Streptomyces malaysiensis TaxID=92644 RepID=UPI000CA26765|nr:MULTISPECIES: hypothetical protein [unclassified Streptomyces]AUA12493.1 hypothetical protein CFP59_04635 [Streptomyces sp. M56]